MNVFQKELILLPYPFSNLEGNKVRPALVVSNDSFNKKGDGTELIMIHSKVPVEQAESYRQGWIDFYWEPLKKYFNKK